MSMVPASSPSLPILPLPYPLILLPAARITIPVSKDQARSVIAIVQENSDRSSPAHNVVGVVPVLPPKLVDDATAVANANNPTSDHEPSQWGCVGRIVRIVRPSPLQPSAPYGLTLQGLTRFKLVEPHPFTSDELIAPLKYLPVFYPSNGLKDIPKAETIQTFKDAALKLLNRLNSDSGPNQGRKEAWGKLSDLVEEVDDQRVSWFADVMVGAVNGEYFDKLGYLSTQDTESRLTKAIEMFTKQTSISEVSKKISTAVSESLSKQQKEFFLRQQLAAIQRELASITGDKSGEFDDDEQSEQDDMAELKRKIDAMTDGSEEKKMGIREFRRLKRIPQGSVEQGVIRTYLEWLTSVPWPKPEALPLESIETMRSPQFLVKARAQLDNDHFGLEKIKKRLVEHLAVVRLKFLVAESQRISSASNVADKPPPPPPPPHSKENPPSAAIKTTVPAPPLPRTINRAPILLFVGPPGVGKTSLGQSIAKALHRPFQRISLGGVRDEAEIRGHRRTYVASGPGTIIQALRRAGRPDLVLLLDEIDKVGHGNFHGDPSAALLEVLDPEQNHSFNDHYINVPVDLSQVLFICTANTLDTISAPLLDRCEIIQLNGYTYDEKMHIARRFLLPKQLLTNGMSLGQVELTDDALECIATLYTREAGVRSLERVIGSVIRGKVVEWADLVDNHPDTPNDNAQEQASANILVRGREDWKRIIRKDDLEAIIGPPRWDGEERDREERRGIVWGLVVMGMGEGAVMPIETIAVPGHGGLKLTGSLGEVIRESGELALSWVKTHAYALHVTNKPSQDPLLVPDPIDIHLHLPAGAQRKDGPSAGVAMVCALVSLLTGASVPTHIAMTGEITLRGRVTQIGGVKEKVLGAHRAKITKIILPFANRQDVEQDIPKEIKSQMEFAYVKTLEEALAAAFDSQLDWRPRSIVVESRL